MKAKLLVLLTSTTLILAVVCVWQHKRLRSAEAELSRAHSDLLAETQARADQQSRSKALEQHQAGLSEQIMALSGLVAKLRATEALSASNSVRTAKSANANEAAADEGGLFGGKGFGAMFSKMMKDPAMKEMMRSQQRAIVNKMYGPLFKDLNLSADQKNQFMEFLLDEQMSGIDKAGVMFGSDGKFDPAKIAETAKADEAQANERLKALLGDEQFAYYEDYKKTMSDRMQLEELKTQLEDTKSPLSDKQLKDLLLLIADEHAKNPRSEYKPSSAADFEKIFSGDGLEKQLQWQEETNQRVLARAGQILDPEQVKAYSDFQKQQINMQRLGITMAREMFGKKSNASQGETQVHVEIAPFTRP